jgi:hypothetical protein
VAMFAIEHEDCSRNNCFGTRRQVPACTSTSPRRHAQSTFGVASYVRALMTTMTIYWISISAQIAMYRSQLKSFCRLCSFSPWSRHMTDVSRSWQLAGGDDVASRFARDREAASARSLVSRRVNNDHDSKARSALQHDKHWMKPIFCCPSSRGPNKTRIAIWSPSLLGWCEIQKFRHALHCMRCESAMYMVHAL